MVIHSIREDDANDVEEERCITCGTKGKVNVIHNYYTRIGGELFRVYIKRCEVCENKRIEMWKLHLVVDADEEEDKHE